MLTETINVSEPLNIPADPHAAWSTVIYRLGEISSTLDSMQELLKLQGCQIEAIEHRLSGNGGPGLVTRVDLLEDWSKVRKSEIKEARANQWKLVLGVFASLATVAMGAVYEVWKHVKGVHP